jgi:hypothetical protein
METPQQNETAQDLETDNNKSIKELLLNILERLDKIENDTDKVNKEILLYIIKQCLFNKFCFSKLDRTINTLA